MAKRSVPGKRRTALVGFKARIDDHEKVMAFADSQGRPASDVMRFAIAEYMRNRGGPELSDGPVAAGNSATLSGVQTDTEREEEMRQELRRLNEQVAQAIETLPGLIATQTREISANIATMTQALSSQLERNAGKIDEAGEVLTQIRDDQRSLALAQTQIAADVERLGRERGEDGRAH